jgi:hypothetical protein
MTYFLKKINFISENTSRTPLKNMSSKKRIRLNSPSDIIDLNKNLKAPIIMNMINL